MEHEFWGGGQDRFLKGSFPVPEHQQICQAGCNVSQIDEDIGHGPQT
jgi:hypothetical protein